MLMVLLAIILTLVLVVGLHEAGHALAAKLFGVKIQRISIGFGKPIFSWKDRQGQEWVWATWPLGGYVKLLNSRIQEVNPKDYSHCFDKRPAWQRIVILLAGGLANFLVALLALTIFYMAGYQRVIPVIKEVMPNSIAAQAGLQPQDRFLSIANWPTNSWQEVGNVLIVNLGKQDVAATVADAKQSVKQVRLNLSGKFNKQAKGLAGFLGITLEKSAQYKEHVAPQSLITAIQHAVNTSWRMLVFLILTLKQVLIGAVSFSLLLGPIGLISVSAGSLNQGFITFLYFIANFSLAVGLVNLFPIPGLDGGSIVLTLLEKIRGRPISVALEILMYRLAFIVFCVFLVQLIVNDLQRFLVH
ncbi:membrane associated zinc metalloprotease [Legionella beliardensis]|uniref:Membrane associated zinc metalloprotease n=1 Tax=Legionella beliardensis TaxID=91822 RepID=A0A378I3Y9_9GAMM|nr:site-2 protease family protein [Legionella beliardensis]STX29470.1 membrane associated zinc metalloprotease [Legionella beliardensis]